MPVIRTIFAAAALLAAPLLPAVQILDVDVDVRNGRYHLRGESIIAAPAPFIHDILMDYDNFHRLTNGITETGYMPESPGGGRVAYTRVDTCVLFFCRRVTKVERIVTDTGHEIETIAIPEESDFLFNHTRWVLESVDGGTRVIYEAEIEPDFWMPPLVGSWAIRRKLAHSAEEIGERIEYLSETGQPITILDN